VVATPKGVRGAQRDALTAVAGAFGYIVCFIAEIEDPGMISAIGTISTFFLHRSIPDVADRLNGRLNR